MFGRIQSRSLSRRGRVARRIPNTCEYSYSEGRIGCGTECIEASQDDNASDAAGGAGVVCKSIVYCVS